MPPAAPVNLAHVPEVPFDPLVGAYQRFGASYEPWEYTGWVDECLSWKETCYIGDWSPLSKLIISGPGALDFISRFTVNGYARYDIGQAKHVIMCNSRGQIMGEGVLMRLAEDRFLFTSGPAIPWMQYQFGLGRYDAVLETVSAEQFIFQIQGPNALYVVEDVLRESVRDIGFMRFREARIDGVAVQVLRQGMAGEIGYELHGPSEHGVAIYNRFLEAGAKWGIRRLGGRSKPVNHVEACFPTPSVDYIPAIFGEEEKDYLAYLQERAPLFIRIMRPAGSYEADDISAYYRNPVELGWGRNIRFDRDFLGREALRAEFDNPSRVIASLVWNSDDVADVYASLLRPGTPYAFMEMPRNVSGTMWTDKVLAGGELVGASTSRCYSYHFRQMLSLATIAPQHSVPGTQVDLVWGPSSGPQKNIRATVAPAPYKADNRKVDVNALPSYI